MANITNTTDLYISNTQFKKIIGNQNILLIIKE